MKINSELSKWTRKQSNICVNKNIHVDSGFLCIFFNGIVILTCIRAFNNMMCKITCLSCTLNSQGTCFVLQQLMYYFVLQLPMYCFVLTVYVLFCTPTIYVLFCTPTVYNVMLCTTTVYMYCFVLQQSICNVLYYKSICTVLYYNSPYTA